MPKPTPIRVTVWGEYRHEKVNPAVSEIYPRGMHETIAEALRKEPGLAVSTATLDEPEHGLGLRQLSETDVLIWWGHLAHHEVADGVVDRVQQRVLEGMGLIVLHSGHFSKIFRRLMGSTCNLKWRETPPNREIVWVIAPGHPIAAGIDDHFALPQEEMYGEYFDVPQPTETIFISHFSGGEVFRSGMTWTRGAGRIFYFRPGHETHPTYHDANIQRVIANAVGWAAPIRASSSPTFGRRDAGWLEGK